MKFESKIEPNNIYNMDCLKGMKLIPDKSIDLVLTDPPYLINYSTNRRKDKGHDFCSPIIGDQNEELIKNVIKELYRVLKDNTALYMFCSFEKVWFFRNELVKYFKLKNMIIWKKNNWTAGDLDCQFGKQYEILLYCNKGKSRIRFKRYSDVWEYRKINPKEALHQNQKPIGILQQAIISSSDVDNIVFDPFIGSGSTALASIRLGRKYIGFEIEKKYFEIAKKRISEEEGQLKLDLIL